MKTQSCGRNGGKNNMIIKDNDNFGNIELLTSEKIKHILELIDGYMAEIPYTIHEIRQDDVNDKHGRIDIEIRYVDDGNCLIQQKLLILDNELIDGKTFHKRYSEWYK